jgi:ribosomal protein S18 acetylase RimI-like enzyme
MTVHAARPASPARLRGTASIRRLIDREETKRLLEPSRPYAAYALAYLDPRLFPLAEFYEVSARERRALVMHASGGLGPTTLTMGDPALLLSLLQLHPGGRQTFLTCEVEQVDAILTSHNLWRPQTMLRMSLNRDSFVAPAARPEVRRLIASDAPELNRFYAIEEEGLRYSGRQVSEAVCYGVFFRDRLVAAAGTHIHSAHEGIGVLGNVFTHPDFRNRGFGTAVTAAVATRLLEQCELVVLNVDPANRTARHIYEQLGFQESGRLVESLATRRHLSPLPLLRRTLARRRSKKPGMEVVNL